MLTGRTFREEDPHLQVASGQADDGSFVQLGRDGGGQRQQLGQLIKFTVFFLPPSPGGVFRLFLHGVLFTGRVSSSRLRRSGWVSVVTIQRDTVPWLPVLAGGEQETEFQGVYRLAARWTAHRGRNMKRRLSLRHNVFTAEYII